MLRIFTQFSDNSAKINAFLLHSKIKEQFNYRNCNIVIVISPSLLILKLDVELLGLSIQSKKLFVYRNAIPHNIKVGLQLPTANPNILQGINDYISVGSWGLQYVLKKTDSFNELQIRRIGKSEIGNKSHP